MRISTIVTGLGGGLVVAAALAAPLYIGLPARYLTASWPYMTPEGSMWGFLGAFVLSIAVGLVAAALQPDDSIRSGTVAGLWSGLVASLAMVVPAAAVEACSDFVVLVQTSPALAEAEDFAEVSRRAIVAVVWYPVAAAACTLMAGLSLGAVGGVLHDLWRGLPGPTKRPARWSLVPVLGLAAGLLLTAVSMLGLTYLTGTVLPQLGGGGQSLGHVMKLASPAAMALVFATGFLAWTLRDAQLLYQERRRLRGTVWGAAATGMLLVMLIEMGALFPSTWASPVTWLTLLSGGAVGIVTLMLSSRADEYLDPEPRTVGELVGDSLSISFLVLGQGVLTAGGAAAAFGIVLVPYLEVALQGAAGPGVPAATLVARVFQLHWALTSGLIALSAVWLVASLPLWLFGRAVVVRGR